MTSKKELKSYIKKLEKTILEHQNHIHEALPILFWKNKLAKTHPELVPEFKITPFSEDLVILQQEKKHDQKSNNS